MDIIWLKEFAESWRDRVAQDRLPHALLLTGSFGVGKRAAAAWLAGLRLAAGKTADLPQYPVPALDHPDLHRVVPEEGRATISVDQIRALVSELVLTSHAGSGKVAVIEPANAMTDNAANSLLKTLEEPPGDTMLILVADRTGRLPATVFSRCQRVDIPTPGEADGVAWLDRLQPGAAWAQALSLAGNAPLAAIGMLELLDTHTSMSRDFHAVALGESSPLEVAARWTKLEPHFVLDWLARRIQQAILGAAGVHRPSPDGIPTESVLQRMDRRNLFCYLDTINRLRGQAAGSFNVQLTYEGLLIDWAEGLVNCGRGTRGSGMAMPAMR
jgi:DNA polymerase III subunit delta'